MTEPCSGWERERSKVPAPTLYCKEGDQASWSLVGVTVKSRGFTEGPFSVSKSGVHSMPNQASSRFWGPQSPATSKAACKPVVREMSHRPWPSRQSVFSSLTGAIEIGESFRSVTVSSFE